MRRYMRAAVAALVLFSPAIASADEDPGAAAPATIEELDRRIAEALDGSPVVGMQVALVDETGARWAKAYGHLDRDRTRQATNESIFRAGSITKSFTAALAMILAEEGAIDLDAPLREVAPHIAFANRWEETDPVRLVHLIEHTTGWDDIQFSEYRDFGPDASLLDGLAFNPKSRTSRWRPGRYSSYCNAGPAALGAAIEAATGRDFGVLLAERVFLPLGIADAGLERSPSLEARLSKSYSPAGAEEPYVHIGMAPSGALNISAQELAKFVAFLIRRGEAKGEALIPREGIARMERPSTTLAARAGLAAGYGLGIFTSYTNDRVFYGHSGGIDGFAAQYGYAPDLGAGYVVMSNTAAGEPLRAVQKLLVAYLARDSATAPAPAADEDLARYEGFYRQITPRSELMRIAGDIFDFARVYAEDGVLVVAPPFGGGVRLTPLGGGLFTAEGRAEPDRVFLTTPEGAVEMHRSFQNAYRRLPIVEAYAPFFFVAAILLVTASALLLDVVWLAGRPFGAFRASNRWRVWLWPHLAFAAIGLMVAGFAFGAGGTSAEFVTRLGAPSPYSLAITAGSALLPVFAALGLAAAFRTKSASGFARAHAGLASSAMLALAAFLFAYGWIAITVWSYAPAVTGA